MKGNIGLLEMQKKVLPFNVIKLEHEGFHIQCDQGSHFYDALHSHPEIQLTLVLEGEGRVVVGDYVGDFGPGDIYLIGSEQPHVFKNYPDYYESDSQLTVRSLSLFFQTVTFGSALNTLPEMKSIRDLLQRSECGILVTVKDPERFKDIFEGLLVKESYSRLIDFYALLGHLVLANSLDTLASQSSSAVTESDGVRLKKIIHLAMQEFTRPIPLEEAAELAGLSKSAFCRYFKKHTRMSFTQFLHETRVGHACYLLQQKEEYSIREVARLSGFGNISHFNRTFKEVIEMTPKQFVELSLIHI